MKYFIIAILLLVIVITVALGKTPKSNNHLAENYFNELEDTPKTMEIEGIKSKFLTVFEDFKIGGQEQTVRQLYAEKLYFNDTFKIINNIDDLVEHIVNTAKQVKSTTVEVLDVAKSGSDYYVRWVMVMEFKVKRKDIYSKSIGMSQLRFNADGKIIFHQDYWDSTEGFFQHLPYIGYFIRKVRSKL
ncbi:MAG: DUF2358 domain-containing protein [Flavobacteriaceae bacterium]|nr:DUF2358 domain-containing protein [Flavobacteriaceae bacterium]